MEYKKKLQVVNIVFTIVMLITLLVAVSVLVYGLFAQQGENANYNFEDDADKFSYYFRFMGIVAFILMQFPIFIAEADLFFNTRYFIMPKEYRYKFKTVLNIILSIFSIATIAVFLISGAAGMDFEDVFIYWIVGFLCYIFLRIIYLVYTLAVNRRESRYYN